MERVGTKRNDHQDVTKLLIKLGIKNKKDRKIYHDYIRSCHYGVEGREEKYCSQDKKLLRNGFDAWQVVPIQYRRNWQDQPD